MGKYTNQEKFIICFECLRFEQISDKASKFKRGLIFFKNFKELKLFTNNEKVFKSWNDFLKLCLISHNFHEQYDVKKMIWKGHFAKMYYAVNKETEKPFAIKAFSKEGLLTENTI